MPRISEMINSNYLKKEDVEDDTVVTIVGVKKANIAREDQDAEFKWLMKFAEFEKPMVLNSTNIQLLARACGSDETDNWKDCQVVLYVDDNVSFGGKLVGGLRIKGLKKQKAANAQAPATQTGRALPSDGSSPVTDNDLDW